MPHIVTVTMNPALDIHTTVPRLMDTEKMRCGRPRYDPGGDGINVARAALRLGASTTAVIVSGGYIGQRVESLLVDDGLDIHAIRVDEPTRESLVIVDEHNGECYRFVLPGPYLQPDDELRCLQTVNDCAVSASHLVVSGSLPPGCSPGFFWAVARIADHHGCVLVVDWPTPPRISRAGTSCHRTPNHWRDCARRTTCWNRRSCPTSTPKRPSSILFSQNRWGAVKQRRR